eukprot:SAG31_NODE_12722_length_921_cov_1.312652_1_plen_87_part_00
MPSCRKTELLVPPSSQRELGEKRFHELRAAHEVRYMQLIEFFKAQEPNWVKPDEVVECAAPPRLRSAICDAAPNILQNRGHHLPLI